MRSLLVLAALLSAAVHADAQSGPRPVVTNGQVVDRPAPGGLAPTVARIAAGASDVVWVGYAVPMAAGDHRFCCVNSNDPDCCHGCTLEPTAKGGTKPTPSPGSRVQTVQLEPSATLVVLARLEAGRVGRVRTFSDDCRLDAGGRTVHWLTGVRPADSVTWLTGLAGAAVGRRLSEGALTALAFHAEPAALDWLIGAARSGGSTHLRGQALFWLSQRAGNRAVGAIAEAVQRDPDTEVKKRAVFALSQLPRDEGVPRLIAIARGHSNKAVQKQAFFWLGQSKDPRALRFFSEILEPR